MADEVPGTWSIMYSASTTLSAPSSISIEKLSDHEIILNWDYSLLRTNSKYWIPSNKKGSVKQNNYSSKKINTSNNAVNATFSRKMRQIIIFVHCCLIFS